MLVAAVDQGSSSTKGALLDARTGEAVAVASAPVAIHRDGERAEHDPEAVLASVRRVLDELATAGRPAALALACQRSTCLLWERAGGRPLTVALSWQDTSAASRVRELAPLAGEVARRTGLRLTPYYAGPKLARLLDETPGARERAAAGELVAGTLDAFLAHRLAGRPTTEPGHAGRTLLYALDAGGWDSWLCARFGVPEAALPELLPSVGARGAVTWAGEDGAVPLVAVAGDQQAALVGNAGEDDTVVVAHFGTGAFVLAGAGQAPRRHPGLLAAVAWSRGAERRFQLEGSVNSAGSAVEWAARLAGVALPDLPDDPLDPERLPLCLPGFVGVAAPWWVPTPGALVAGVRLEHDALALLRGTLAGVAMRVADCVESLVEAGLAPRVVRASGRLATLAPLAQLLADTTGLPVEVMAEEEAGLRGAARLAALALASGGDAAAGPATGPRLPDWPLRMRERREPSWGAARRSAARSRWRDFVAAATAVLPAPEGS